MENVLDFVAHYAPDASDAILDRIDTLGVGDLPVKWNSRLRVCLGRAKFSGATYEPKTIELNPRLGLETGFDAIRETFLHELGHILAGWHAAHGPAWKAACRALGLANPVAKSPAGTHAKTVQRTPVRVVARCRKCGMEIKRRRALKRGSYYTHSGSCGGDVVAVRA